MTEPVTRGRTIFLTGPPLAGKTSTAMAWAAQRPHLTSALDWDQIQTTLFGPRLQEGAGNISDQYRFAAKVAAATADQITATGVDCVIAGARVPASPADPPEWIGVWDDLDQLDPITIVLLPSLETRLERRRSDPNRLTGGRHPYSEEEVRESHSWAWQSWREQPRATVLDTSDMTRSEVADAIELTVANVSGHDQ